MLCEACGTCAATKTWVDDRHRMPESYRLCTTCHDLVIEERRTAMGSSKRDPDNAKIANAILRALADSDGLSQQQIRIAINAEPDEYRTINGILTSLGKRGEVSTVSGRYLLIPKGRRQLEPDASPPPVTSLGRDAREPGPLWTQAETAALSDLRDAVERVGIQGRNLFVTCELLTAAREAIEVTEQRKEKAEEAQRSIVEARIRLEDEHRAEKAAHDETRMRLDISTAEVARLQAETEKVSDENNALRAEVDTLRRAAPITGWGNAQTVELAIDVSRERAVAEARLADAEAEITRLRADLEGALAAEKVTAEKLAEAESEVICLRVGGPYWTRQGDRHTLSILRPVEIAVLLVDPASVGWEAGRHNGRVVGSGPEALDLAQLLAEVAAGVRS